MSEAFYLRDPDGLEIEVYADNDRSRWPWNGNELDAAVLPLDLRDLLSIPHSMWSGVPSGTTMGHIHLYVGDLKQADRLYRVGLGLNVRTSSIPGALFLAAGDYHHHIGLNTWAGAVPPAGDSDPRLNWWSLKAPQEQLPALQNQMLESGWVLRPDGFFADPCGSALKLESVAG